MTNKTDAKIIPEVDLQQQVQVLVRDSYGWIQTHWLQILVSTGIAIAIILVLHLVRRWALKLCERGAGTATWYSILGRAASKTSNFFILMIALRLVTGYAAPPQTVETTISFLFTVSAVFQAAIWVRELIFGAIEHRTTSETYHNEGLASALGIIRLLVTVVLFAIASVMVLSNVGVNVTGLVAGLGVGGIAIGLAAQGIFGDLIAALAILFDKPFRLGEKVRFDSTAGTVQAIGLKSTRIRTFSGEELVIANRQLLDKVIENLTHRNHTRAKLVVGVAYETPIEKLEALPALLTEIVEASGARLSRASYEGFGASSIDLVVEFDVPGDDAHASQDARDKVMLGIVRRFAEQGIAIPYPTQTSYTAAPDGTIIMPYPDPEPPAPAGADPRREQS